MKTLQTIPISKPDLTELEAQAAFDSVLSGWVTQGPKVKEFEEMFAEYTGAKFAVAVSSGTAALHLCMIVAGIGPGDEVICPSMSHIATANCIRYAGATPVFAEVKPYDFNLDPIDAEAKITGKTKAILIAHQLGMPADIDEFRSVCDKHGIMLIEDAACAAGSAYKGRKIGSHSELVSFSFHPRKVLTTGEGGMITTSNEQFATRLRSLRQHGLQASSYERHGSDTQQPDEHTELGYNYRLSDILAAVGASQLKRLDEIVSLRRSIAREYSEKLSSVNWLTTPDEGEHRTTNYQSYAITLGDDSPVSRDELLMHLHSQGIAAKKGVMTAHREPAYSGLSENVSLPVTEHASDNSLLLPLHQALTESELDLIISAFKKI